MKPILGRPMIEWIAQRVRAARCIQRVVLATTDRPEDNRLVDWAHRFGIGCYRGSAQDVLSRVVGAARDFHADPIVEILGDNPLVDPCLIDDLALFFERGGYDYAVPVTVECPRADPVLKRFPIGIRAQVLHPSTLEHCLGWTTDPAFREHSTGYILRHPEQFRIGYLEAAAQWASWCQPEWNLAVNTEPNLDLICRIFERCGANDPCFSTQQALDLLRENPPWHSLMGPIPTVHETLRR